MKNNKPGACRANSLPTEGSSGTRKKRRGRVSFSSLPPTKFEVENLSGDGDDKPVTPSKSPRPYRIRKRTDRPTSPPSPKLKENAFTYDTTSHANNKIDNVNEMLMDFLEEIEAENVTIDDCLRDAVDLGVLEVSEAQQVLPSFRVPKIINEEYRKSSSMECRDDITELNQDPDVLEKVNTTSLEKLLDVFSTMSAEDLSKCNKRTLGKLYRLTSYKDYQIKQNFEQRLHESSHSSDSERMRKLSDDSFNTGESMDEASSTEISCLSSESSDAFDSLSSGSSKEDRTGWCSSTPQHSPDMRKPRNINDAMPTLIDEGILTPKQVWKILDSEDGSKALTKLMKEMCDTSQPVYELASKLKETNLVDDVVQKWRIETDNIHKLNEANLSKSEEGNRNPAHTEWWKSPRTTTCNSRRKCSSVFYRSSEDEDASDTSFKEVSDFLEYWAEENDIPSRVTDALRIHGIREEDQLLDMNKEELDAFDLPWVRKAQLWVAIEGLKLDRAYMHAHHKLANSVKLLNMLA